MVVFFFFFGEFLQPGDKTKWLASPTKGFLRFFLKTNLANFRNLVTKKKAGESNRGISEISFFFNF